LSPLDHILIERTIINNTKNYNNTKFINRHNALGGYIDADIRLRSVLTLA